MSHAPKNVTVLPGKVIPSDATVQISKQSPVYQGPGLPFGGHEQGMIKFKSNVDLIRDSIIQILGTRLGERVGVPTFGSTLYQHLFEPSDVVLTSSAEIAVETAIRQWEPRVVLESVSSVINTDRTQLTLFISFTIKRLGLPVTLRYEQQLP